MAPGPTVRVRSRLSKAASLSKTNGNFDELAFQAFQTRGVVGLPIRVNLLDLRFVPWDEALLAQLAEQLTLNQ